MPNILTGGRTFNPQLSTLPGQQEDINIFSILDQQYQEATRSVETQFGQVQEELLRDVKYKLKTLSDKYWQERKYIEDLKAPADQKKQKLLQLNNKYELAAITAKSKVKPDTDALNTQKQQQLVALQQDYQQRQIRINQIQDLVDKGVVQDPYAALQEQYQIAGINLPISAFRPPKPLSMEEMAEQQANIAFQIINLEEAMKTATGDERQAIVEQIIDLENQRTQLMGLQLPEVRTAIEKSNRLSKIGLQMSAGRKPGTLAEGVWQKKQKGLGTGKLRLFGLPGNIAASILERKAKKPQQKTKSNKPIYQKNKTTGQSRVSYDGGKTWQIIG